MLIAGDTESFFRSLIMQGWEFLVQEHEGRKSVASINLWKTSFTRQDHACTWIRQTDPEVYLTQLDWQYKKKCSKWRLWTVLILAEYDLNWWYVFVASTQLKLTQMYVYSRLPLTVGKRLLHVLSSLSKCLLSKCELIHVTRVQVRFFGR